MAARIPQVDLEAQELLYRRIFEQGPLAITLIDADFRFIQVNHQCCEILGYREAELLERTFIEVTHPDDIDLDLELSHQVFRGDIPYFQIEKRFIHKNGGVIWARLTATVMRDELNQPLFGLGMLEDITAQKQAHTVLRESEALFRTFFESAAMGAVWCRTTSTRIKMCNDRFAQWLGYQREDLYDVDFLALTHEADRDLICRAFQQLAEERLETARLEKRYLRRDGQVVWAEVEVASASVTAGGGREVFAFIRDISDRRAAEQLLAANEQRLRLLTDALPVAIAYVDQTMRYRFVNQTYANWFGRTQADILGQPCAEVLGPENYTQIQSHIEAVFKGEQVVFESISQPPLSPGVNIAGMYIPHVDAEQEVVGFYALLQDMTIHRRSEAELRRSAERLENLNHMSQAILENLSSQAIVDITLEHATRLVPCQRASITLFHFPKRTMTLLGARFAGETRIGAGVELTFEQFGDISTLERGDVRRVDDLSTQKAYVEVELQLLAEGLRSYINVPLIARNQLVGSLNLASTAPGHFTYSNTQIAREIAAPVAIAFQQARLQADLEAQSHMLQQTNVELRREITEREKAEQELRRYTERLELLHQMNLEILSAQSPKAIAQGVVDRLPQLITCQRASVTIFDLEARKGHILATNGISPMSYRAGKSISLSSHFSFMQHYEPSRVYQIEDVIALTQVKPSSPTLQQEGFPLFVTAPILAQGKLIGALNVASQRPEVYTDAYLDIVRMVAMALAAALQQAYLLEQVQDQAEDLEQRVIERTAELKAAQEDLLRQTRLATLGQLTATVSHELRNPLATLRTSFYHIERQTRKQGLHVERALERIDRNITRCDHIISELL